MSHAAIVLSSTVDLREPSPSSSTTVSHSALDELELHRRPRYVRAVGMKGQDIGSDHRAHGDETGCWAPQGRVELARVDEHRCGTGHHLASEVLDLGFERDPLRGRLPGHREIDRLSTVPIGVEHDVFLEQFARFAGFCLRSRS